MQLNDPDVSFDLEDCRFAVRALESEAYGAVINALRAKGSLGQYYHLILEHLRLIFDVSFDRHKAEVRRALTDPILCKISAGLNPQTEVNFEWTEEAKRTCGNANYAAAVALESLSSYRFNFMRSSKNDLLLELADQLATLGVEHNRSKSLEEEFFQATKRSKVAPPAVSKRDETPLDVPLPRPKAAEEPPTSGPKEAQAVQNPKLQVVAPGLKRKALQKGTNKAAVVTSPIASPAVVTEQIRRGAGRPRKNPMDLATAKQRVAKFVIQRGSSSFRPRGGSTRGRGLKRYLPVSTPITIQHLSPQRPPSVQGRSHWNQTPPPFYPFRPQFGSSPPRVVQHSASTFPSSTATSPAVRSPISSQKLSPTRPFRKRPALTPGTSNWPSSNSQLQPRVMAGSGGRVPVAPLSVMLPVSTSASSRGSGLTKPYTQPSSPTRPFLTGEAPGVYADDYNANAMDERPSSGTAANAGPTASLQPRQFLSTLSATYYAQNPSTTTKARRISPGILSHHGASVPTIHDSSGGVGLSSKYGSISIKSRKDMPHLEAATTSSPGTSSALEKISLPLRRLDQSTQKVIVLPSAIIRRTQQPAAMTTTSSQPDHTKSTPQQSLIIVRRATSMPSSSQLIARASTTPVPSSPAPSVGSVATSSEIQEEPI